MEHCSQAPTRIVFRTANNQLRDGNVDGDDTQPLEDSQETGGIFDDIEALAGIRHVHFHQEDPEIIGMQPQDTIQWYRMGTDRPASPEHPLSNDNVNLTMDEKYQELPATKLNLIFIRFSHTEPRCLVDKSYISSHSRH